MSVEPGQTATLPCSLPSATSKVWRHQADGNTDDRAIARNGVVVSARRERFHVTAEGLEIWNVQRTDQGTYTCADQQDRGHKLLIRLEVLCKAFTKLSAPSDANA